MSLGTITVGAGQGGKPKAPSFRKKISFPGDDSYPTGGTANFEAAVQSALSLEVDLIAILPNDCGGYVPVYDDVNDKLKVYYADYDAVADGALIEVANATNLSGTTFNVVVLCD